MGKQYTTGGDIRRCPNCGANWHEEAEVRSYDPETGQDKLVSVTPAGKHPANGCARGPAIK